VPVIRGTLGGLIALLAVCAIAFAPAGPTTSAAAAPGEPPPDGGTAASGAPALKTAVSGPFVNGFHSLRQLATEESVVPPAFNVYANTMDGYVEPLLSGIKPLVYVPNSNANTLDIIDPATMRVVDHLNVGAIPHHVTPSWDMKELYVDNEGSSQLSVIDPATAKITRTISVPYPYNLYFTPDGSKAIVVVERLARLDFRDPHTWQLIKSVPIPWRGIDHLDFSADGSYLIGSTEWSGILVKVDTRTMELVGSLNVGGLPIDVRLAPDGKEFYVANQGTRYVPGVGNTSGVHVIDGDAMRELAFLPTPRGAHGIQVSRDTHFMYVSDRDSGYISVIDVALQKVVANWKVGGSPDMFQLSPDGNKLWVSSRYNAGVMVVNTDDGVLLQTIRAGAGAHGLTYFPNAGRYSTGHNGVYR
jgi:YVTN family beta-propeller protein